MSPTSAKQSVLGKLQLMGGVTPSMAPRLELVFQPTLVIAAGRIDAAGAELANGFVEPLTKAIREVMMPSIQQNFASGGRPAWEPLSESTLEIRRRFGVGGTRTLYVTGRLENVASSFEIWTITRAFATIRDLPPSVWYGKIHQAGYEGQNSMKRRLRKTGGDVGAAHESLMADQISAMRSGTTLGGGGVAAIPARPFIVFQPEDEDEITQIFIDWMEKVFEKHWPGR